MRFAGTALPPVLFVLGCMQAIADGPLVTVALGSAAVQAGNKADLSLSVTVPPGQQVAGLNWTLQYPASQFENIVVTSGPAADAAKKWVKCNPIAGGMKCLVYGMNSNVLASGTVAKVTFDVKKGVAKSSVGIHVADVTIASPAGALVRASASDGAISIH
jgi:hypothetical protein